MDLMGMSTMMGSMPPSATGADMATMQECIEACQACSMVATMCADACAGMDGLGRCSSTCMNMADMATTMMQMMLRPMAHDMTVMRSMLEACVAMCRACIDECAMHADHHEPCRICMMACENMRDACESRMAKLA